MMVTREGADQSSVHDLWCVAWTRLGMMRGARAVRCGGRPKEQ